MTRDKLHYKLRASLEHLMAHHRDARLVVRAHAILWRDEGVTVKKIAQDLKTSRQNVYNWLHRFEQRQGLTPELRLADAAHPGRPAILKGTIDLLIEEVIDRYPRQWGYRATVWTAPLLAIHFRQKHHLSVSSDRVRLALRRLGIRWKRPRHTLAQRRPTWRQAQGGLKRGFFTDFAP